jgi:RNA polymerase sigma-70 factor (ECF subfamily)
MSEPDRSRAEPSGDIEALARVYTGALRRFFERRILEHADVDDLIQEVFLRLTRRGVDDVAYLPGYLFETAANVLRDRLRHRIRRRSDQHGELDEAQEHDAAFTPERVLLGREAIKRLVVALNGLPDRTRAIFILRRYDGHSYQDIARRLGISVSSVEKHMAKAVPYLAARMRDDE